MTDKSLTVTHTDRPVLLKTTTQIATTATATTSTDNDKEELQQLLLQPACPKELPSNRRLLLLTNVQPEHGSTAMISLLMSSPHLSTLCRNHKRECEGFLVAKARMCPKPGSHCMQPWPNITMPVKFTNPDYFHLLEVHSHYWNLSQPILQDKLFPREVGYTQLMNIAYEADLPPQMKEQGIEHLDQAQIFMWTPLCTMALQSHNKKRLTGNKRRAFIEREMWGLQNMKNRHEQLLRDGIPVLVISFAGMLFDEERTLRRISKFLPCSTTSSEKNETIHAHFIPKLGVDVFAGNGWKVRGSVHSFGQSKDPQECCGYDPSTSTCVDRTLYKTIPMFEDRLVELEAYFRTYSLMEVAG
jgi:hypothetical protein